MKGNEPIKCPICRENNLRHLYTANSLDVIRHISDGKERFNPQYEKKIESLWKNKTASFNRCLNCSFEFANPFVPADAEFYSMIYHSATTYRSDKWEYAISIKAIQEFISKNEIKPRLIEIGAGNGSFLKQLIKDFIPASEMFATEFSEKGAKMIEELGISCFRKNFDAITESDLKGRVNTVCLFQVLEHITAIFEFFSKLNELTLPGARAYISVPNMFHRQFFDRFGYYYDLPPIHVGRYNFNSLSILAESSGWRILQHIIQPTTFKERAFKFIYSKYASWPIQFKAEKIQLKFLRLFFRYGILALLIVLNIRVLAGLRKSNLGTAQWFELERI